jgi:outer membrane protein assembly factor BamA
MGIKKQHTVYISILVFLLGACSATKHLPPNEKLYTGASVKLNSNELTVRERKVLRSDLQGLTRPKPNTRFFGIPIKLNIYNMFRNAKPKSFFGKFRDKSGEPPVLLSAVDLQNNAKILESHAENKGFFNVKVAGDTVVKAKKGRAEYTVEAGGQYKINSVQFDSANSQLSLAIKEAANNSLLKKGDPYNLDVIKGERIRIDLYLKERGYYYFHPEHLIIKVDSTVGNHLVDMIVSVKPEVPVNARQAYRINDVYIYSDYNLTAANEDTLKSMAELYQGYYIIDRRKRFKPQFYPPIMVFDSGDIYNRTDHNLSLSRLINVNEFKFVKNRFEALADSAKLNAYYYLTPLPRNNLRAEINATNKTNNLNGTQLQLNWRNRNFFRGGEQLSISAYIGTEIQFGGNLKDSAGNRKRYNTYRIGAEMNFVIPRFATFGLFNLNKRSAFLPRTNIQLGYDILNRRKLYTLNSYRGGIGYLWKKDAQTQHEFYPISINYVQPLNVTEEYYDNIRSFPYLQRIIDSQFIVGSTYQFNYNEIVTGIQKPNSFYFNGLVDLSGNVAGLIMAKKAGAANKKTLLNAPFDQYIKLEVDGRYYRKLGLKSAWANRLIVGYGNPYGNSEQIPYIKQFVVGGNNSLRAFRSRSVGPGTFKEVNNDDNFFSDQAGDLKLEINTEFRPHINGPLYGAVFIDAGNIWLKNEDPNRPGSKFTKDFINQLAIGGGVGIRLDIVLFVIRLDVGIPLRKPWEQNPWVINQINLGNKDYRKENIIYNIAIGYPF